VFLTLFLIFLKKIIKIMQA